MPITNTPSEGQKKYVVYHNRHDESPHHYTCFFAHTDEEAIAHFKEIKAKPMNAWDWMTLVEEIRPTIPAVLREIASAEGVVTL